MLLLLNWVLTALGTGILKKMRGQVFIIDRFWPDVKNEELSHITTMFSCVTT